MLRTQIQLRDDQVRRLRERAAVEEVSLAEMIRRGVDMLLAETGEARGKRGDAMRVAAAFDSGTPGIAERHDEELEEAYLQW